MSINFDEALLCFMADCIAVADEMYGDKPAAIQEMATRANATFARFESTPARVMEVKSVISAAVA